MKIKLISSVVATTLVFSSSALFAAGGLISSIGEIIHPQI